MSLWARVVAGALALPLLAASAAADDICRCQGVHAESQAAGTCTRTEISGGCKMTWNGSSSRLASAIDNESSRLGAAFQAQGLPPAAVHDLTKQPSEQPLTGIIFRNLDLVPPDAYTFDIITNFLLVALGALHDGDFQGLEQDAADLKLATDEHLLGALKGEGGFEAKGKVAFFSASLGCFRAQIIDSRRPGTVLVKTRFADAETCL